MNTRPTITETPPTPGCPSDLRLDEIVAGTRSRSGDAEHLSRCERCSARLERFETQERQAAAKVATLLARARAEADRRASARPARWPVPAGWFALAAAVAVLLVAVTRNTAQPGEPRAGADEVRSKGVGLRLWVNRDGRVFEGHSGDRFRPGDALRVTVTSSTPTWLFLAGIDAAGAVRAYHPFDGAESVRLEPGTDAPLPDSLVLDDAEGTEYLVALFTAEPLGFGAIERALREWHRRPGEPGRLALPGSHHFIALRKGP